VTTYFVDVDPRELHVPSSRRAGADPYKLQQQIARYGASTAGMPMIWVYETSDGSFVILHDVTRATRIAKLAPGTVLRVAVVDKINKPVGNLPKIGDLLP
jgi:hypothetical protein